MHFRKKSKIFVTKKQTEKIEAVTRSVESSMQPPGLPHGFGIHTIHCTSHPHGDISIFQMEKTPQSKYGDFSHYDAFMDENMGFWTNDLDPYVKEFDVRS